MGYYERWHPQGAYYYAVEHGGFVPSPERTAGTYSKYNSIDDRSTTFSTTPPTSSTASAAAPTTPRRRSATGEITREEAVALCKKFDGEFPARFAEEFFRYISIDKAHFGKAADCFEQPEMDLAYFMHLADRFRSPHLWQYKDGRVEFAPHPLRGRKPLPLGRAAGKPWERRRGMSKKIRLIARLDVKDEYLVKGIQYEGLRKLGDPHDFAVRYYRQGIDELLYLDTVASLYGRNNLGEILRRATADVFIPITAGGGLRSAADVGAVLAAGADKAAVNTAALQRPALITEIARAYGSQCAVVSIQAKRRDPRPPRSRVGSLLRQRARTLRPRRAGMGAAGAGFGRGGDSADQRRLRRLSARHGPGAHRRCGRRSAGACHRRGRGILRRRPCAGRAERGRRRGGGQPAALRKNRRARAQKRAARPPVWR